jgi:hypothetical protein
MAEKEAAKTPWDEYEQNEIIDYIQMEHDAIIDFEKEKLAIQSGCCCYYTINCCSPFFWSDFETKTRAVHLALSNSNIMYLQDKHAVHVQNPCPPCSCCCSCNYREDFKPKIRKLVPYEKITDVEVHESGNNEPIAPCCCTCPPGCNPKSVQVPFSQAFVQTAGSLAVSSRSKASRMPMPSAEG